MNEDGGKKEKDGFCGALFKLADCCAGSYAAGAVEGCGGKGSEQCDVNVCGSVECAFHDGKSQTGNQAQGGAEGAVNVPAANACF